MKYFAKYLPVEEKPNIGDKILHDKLGILMCSYIDGIFHTFKDHTGKEWNLDYNKYPTVKLFLCSRDISWEEGDDRHILVTSDKNLWGEIEDGSIVPIEVSHGYDNDTIVPLIDGNQAEKDTIFKVIGEISPEATWVKEGDEFDDSDCEWEDKPNYHTYVLIKGPFGHFH